MKYLLYDLGEIKEGSMVEISLGYAVNVRVLDEAAYALFKENTAHKFIGGYIERSPYKVGIPSDGHWYVIIDAGSFFGKIKSLVKLFSDRNTDKGVLLIQPTVCDLSPSKVISKTMDFAEAVSKRKLKVFILHYYKDSSGFAAPLAEALDAKGLPVNYQDYVLEPGNDFEEVIKSGLAKYRFGIFVFSRSLLKIGWKAQAIVYVKKQISMGSLYPVWNKITRSMVVNHLPDFEELFPDSPPPEMPELVEDIIETLMK
jgi:hypothetical protein